LDLTKFKKIYMTGTGTVSGVPVRSGADTDLECVKTRKIHIYKEAQVQDPDPDDVPVVSRILTQIGPIRKTSVADPG
jgi:hypothetical protein